MSEPPRLNWDLLERRRLLAGQRARAKGVLWEVDLIGPGFVNLRPVDGGDMRTAYHRDKGCYFLDDEEVSFEKLETVDGPRAERLKEALTRELDSLVTNVIRSIQALESMLTPAQQEQILGSIEQAKVARRKGDLKQLEASLDSMERAAGVIGEAMLRA
jgi:hypothetical protein